jgi:hypothetical protein
VELGYFTPKTVAPFAAIVVHTSLKEDIVSMARGKELHVLREVQASSPAFSAHLASVKAFRSGAISSSELAVDARVARSANRAKHFSKPGQLAAAAAGSLCTPMKAPVAVGGVVSSPFVSSRTRWSECYDEPMVPESWEDLADSAADCGGVVNACPPLLAAPSCPEVLLGLAAHGVPKNRGLRDPAAHDVPMNRGLGPARVPEVLPSVAAACGAALAGGVVAPRADDVKHKDREPDLPAAMVSFLAKLEVLVDRLFCKLGVLGEALSDKSFGVPAVPPAPSVEELGETVAQIVEVKPHEDFLKVAGKDTSEYGSNDLFTDRCSVVADVVPACVSAVRAGTASGEQIGLLLSASNDFLMNQVTIMIDKANSSIVEVIVKLSERLRLVSVDVDYLLKTDDLPPPAAPAAAPAFVEPVDHETHQFLEGQPVVLRGLKSAVFNERCGLVVRAAGPAGRIGVLLWSESAPKNFPALNVFALEPGGASDCVCCGCLSPVSLLRSPACRCGESSERFQMFAKFRHAMMSVEPAPMLPACVPSPLCAAQLSTPKDK